MALNDEGIPIVYQHARNKMPRPLRHKPLHIKPTCKCGATLVHADRIINLRKPQSHWDMDTWMCPTCRRNVVFDCLRSAPLLRADSLDLSASHTIYTPSLGL